MSTTAVSFRKGNTEENDAFAGVTGEIVADLGANEQVSEKATIVLHTGNGVAGGIRMARADLNNITNESISNLANFRQDSGQGTYYGLLRRNMSNYMTNDVNAPTVESLLKTDYHIASRDGQDLSTAYLAGIDGEGGEINRAAGGKYLLNRDLSNLHLNGKNIVRELSYIYWLSNVQTSYLAEGTYQYKDHTYTLTGQNLLAYANMSNVNTADLATAGAGHSGDNLAYANLTNVGYHTIVSYLDAAYNNNEKLQDYEWIENKINVIDPLDSGLTTKYPSAQAVIEYTADLSNKYANVNLDNINSWQIASEKQDLWKIELGVINPGSGYTLPCTIRTTEPHPDGGTIDIVVTRIDENGGILEVKPVAGKEYSHGAVASTTVNDNDPNWRLGGIFSLASVNVNAGKLMLANLSNSDLSNSINTQTARVKYEVTEDNNNPGAIVSVDSVFGELTDTNTTTAGSFAVNRELGGVETKLATQNTSTEKETSIIVTRGNVYLNKLVDISSQGQGPVKDADHQILNRGEMDGRYQLQPSTAVQDNIATFNNALSTVDSGKAFTTIVTNAVTNTSHNKVPTEKAVREAIEEAVTRAVVYKGTVNTENDLPSSGQTNGDLYWIRAFSSNPPAGMITGHSGTAIWNGNLATPAWDFKEDNQNDPDGVSIGFNNGKLAVKISATADNAISIDSIGDGLYVSGNSFVSSSGYVAVAAVSGQSGKVLTNNGTNTSWRTATPEPPTTQGIYHLVVDSNGDATWVNDNRLALGPVTA